ncbi:TPA: DUF3987 domain-containing protein [Pseudomonas aeruginosa]|uniref:YfjI family protein n=1 Tax=Pseudomonas aeruginosa TaxID=287 RepID=UPI000B494876|nr:YfjI family protein [Pseudomonas aeruginosa]MDF3866712.1 YfjI family protein [Pseudomonas denitrificans (nom. rej.)]EKU7417953.1 DUF3987 domain-containing protein [Pseudomonas aeruginosa]MBF2891729.1 DUF3987 domain-containing protein [Pseudomonas aeruginosa]MBF2923865.1 DUF3987 domain-containing protein [Pseudomonas aeruginosa]MBF2938395.1 DUF3987 domain-containing protein [Pseudomonas aeruginosa]
MNEPDSSTLKPNDSVGPRMQDGWPCYHEHSVFEAAVVESSRRLEVPREMSMMCALGAMATACQRHVDVEMPPGNRSPVSLILLAIADSGERKTTTQNYFFGSIDKINEEAIEANAKELREHRIKHKLWSTELRQLERKYIRCANSDDNDAANAVTKEIEQHLRLEPAPAPSDRFLYEDTTPQALIQSLYENSKNGCVLTSEANGIFNGKGMSELDKLNTLWDGGTLIVDRLSRAPISLKGARLTMSLMAQPSVISNFIGRRGDEARGTGFLARFLVAKPKSMAGERTNSVGLATWPRKEAFSNRIREIMEEPLPASRQALTFSEPAKSLWYEINSYLEENMKEDGYYYHMKDHASKLLENISRVAAVMHTFARSSSSEVEIDLFTLQFSLRFAQACSKEFAKSLANEPQVVTDACELANYLLKAAHNDTRNYHILDEGAPGANLQKNSSGLPSHLRDGFKTDITLTKIKQLGPYRLRGRAGSERLQAAIELLGKLGHLSKDKGKYKFSEAIQTVETPLLRNGETFTITALPAYKDQEFVHDSRVTGRPKSGRYCIINNK